MQVSGILGFKALKSKSKQQRVVLFYSLQGLGFWVWGAGFRLGFTYALGLRILHVEGLTLLGYKSGVTACI